VLPAFQDPSGFAAIFGSLSVEPNSKDLRLIERRFGPRSDDVRDRGTQAERNTLLQWLERILDANGLEEVLH
jgi:hypothetical protein